MVSRTLLTSALIVAMTFVGCATDDGNRAGEVTPTTVESSIAPTEKGLPVEALTELLSEANAGDAMVYGSYAEMRDSVDAVALVNIEGAMLGRVIRLGSFDETEDQDPSTMFTLHTMVYQVTIEQVIGGRRPDLLGGTFFVEIRRPTGVADDMIPTLVPDNRRALVFMGDYTSPRGSQIGGGERDAVYLWPTQQGLLVEGAERKPVSLLGGLVVDATMSVDQLARSLT